MIMPLGIKMDTHLINNMFETYLYILFYNAVIITLNLLILSYDILVRPIEHYTRRKQEIVHSILYGFGFFVACLLISQFLIFSVVM